LKLCTRNYVKVKVMQEFTLSGLDGILPIFVLVGVARLLSSNYLVDAVKGDPEFKYNPLGYWVLFVLSLLGYQFAYSAFFIDVPRLVSGTQSAIEYSKEMHDSIAQIWRYTSLLPVIPSAFALVTLTRLKSPFKAFGFIRLLPVFIFDTIICSWQYIFPI
jgi:hypothetical protein